MDGASPTNQGIKVQTLDFPRYGVEPSQGALPKRRNNSRMTRSFKRELEANKANLLYPSDDDVFGHEFNVNDVTVNESLPSLHRQHHYSVTYFPKLELTQHTPKKNMYMSDLNLAYVHRVKLCRKMKGLDQRNWVPELRLHRKQRLEPMMNASESQAHQEYYEWHKHVFPSPVSGMDSDDSDVEHSFDSDSEDSDIFQNSPRFQAGGGGGQLDIQPPRLQNSLRLELSDIPESLPEAKDWNKNSAEAPGGAETIVSQTLLPVNEVENTRRKVNSNDGKNALPVKFGREKEEKDSKKRPSHQSKKSSANNRAIVEKLEQMVLDYEQRYAGDTGDVEVVPRQGRRLGGLVSSSRLHQLLNSKTPLRMENCYNFYM